MKTIQVQLGERSYPIYMESGLLNKIPSILSDQNDGQRWIIISQYNLMELLGFELQADLKNAGFICDFITLPVGEAAKSLNEFSRVISQMIEMRCDRSTTILALGVVLWEMLQDLLHPLLCAGLNIIKFQQLFSPWLILPLVGKQGSISRRVKTW